MSLTRLHTTKLSPAHTRAFGYSEEYDILGVTGDKHLLLLSDPINSTDQCRQDAITSQHGHPSVVRFSPGGSPQPSILLGDLYGPIDVYSTDTLRLHRSYLEHDDKVTGIDWISRETRSFVSCSKDGTVRFYDLSLPHSHTTLSVDYNTCGVRSNPFNLNHIAFGTSAGKFFVYDVRQTSSPYLEVKGHSKTVSGVVFSARDEILSMSLDSTAKLWDITRTVCFRSYVGHVHHTYFVGVDSIKDYIVMGGEDSSVRVYAKDKCNYIACEKLSKEQCFVCGCAWVNGQSTGNQKHILAMDNCGRLATLLLTV